VRPRPVFGVDQFVPDLARFVGFPVDIFHTVSRFL
jgi:hypothetical protein